MGMLYKCCKCIKAFPIFQFCFNACHRIFLLYCNIHTSHSLPQNMKKLK